MRMKLRYIAGIDYSAQCPCMAISRISDIENIYKPEFDYSKYVPLMQSAANSAATEKAQTALARTPISASRPYNVGFQQLRSNMGGGYYGY